jgi:hypothetical protein
MHWTTQLKDDNAKLQGDKAATIEAINELKGYLQSSKFHQDPTVQVQDVLNRLDVILDVAFWGSAS